MHHIEIYVSNLSKTRNFYQWFLEMLDFELYQDWQDGFSFRKNDFYLVFVQTQEKYLDYSYHRCRVGLNHLAFSCHSQSLIDEIRQRLIENKVTLLYDDKYPHAGGKNTYALYFEDPDRIKLEIVLAQFS